MPRERVVSLDGDRLAQYNLLREKGDVGWQ